MPRRISSIICVIPIYGLYMCILVVTRAESILKCYWFCFLNMVVFDHYYYYYYVTTEVVYRGNKRLYH